jgi:hypothetical protein
MTNREIWSQRLHIWLPAAIFFSANLVALGVYRFGYANGVGSLKERLQQVQAEQRSREADHHRREALLQQAMVNRKRIDALYNESFSTRKRRLTGITAEVEALAERAGLEPRTFNYPEQEIEGYGLTKRSFVFSVSGSYLDLRKFINLLEVSDSFLTLEAVTASRGDDSRSAARPAVPGGIPGVGVPGVPPAAAGPISNSPHLNLSLTLSTLFARDGGAVAASGTASRKES